MSCRHGEVLLALHNLWVHQTRAQAVNDRNMNMTPPTGSSPPLQFQFDCLFFSISVLVLAHAHARGMPTCMAWS
ncbi:hypothetical protein HD806DRAFT_135037 [Xylariaceae sp. AK1471]|nr:hypothetical protein HD806DRAFT_135037 [Xylariaceae sp. AK1471]